MSSIASSIYYRPHITRKADSVLLGNTIAFIIGSVVGYFSIDQIKPNWVYEDTKQGKKYDVEKTIAYSLLIGLAFAILHMAIIHFARRK